MDRKACGLYVKGPQFQASMGTLGMDPLCRGGTGGNPPHRPHTVLRDLVLVSPRGSCGSEWAFSILVVPSNAQLSFLSTAQPPPPASHPAVSMSGVSGTCRFVPDGLDGGQFPVGGQFFKMGEWKHLHST